MTSDFCNEMINLSQPVRKKYSGKKGLLFNMPPSASFYPKNGIWFNRSATRTILLPNNLVDTRVNLSISESGDCLSIKKNEMGNFKIKSIKRDGKVVNATLFITYLSPSFLKAHISLASTGELVIKPTSKVKFSSSLPQVNTNVRG